MVTEPAYRSDTRPDFVPLKETLGSYRGFVYAGDLGSELVNGRLTAAEALGHREFSLTKLYRSA